MATKASTKKAAPKKAAVKTTKTTAVSAKSAPKKAAVKKATSKVDPVVKAEPVAEAKPTAEGKKEKKTAVAEINVSVASKQEIIETFAQKNGDTGSPEVQVALLSNKIGRLIEHLNENKKDNHSRRGLLKIVAKRRRILSYLQGMDDGRYKGLIGKLGLKK